MLKNHAIASVDAARTALISQNIRKKGHDAEGFFEEIKLGNL